MSAEKPCFLCGNKGAKAFGYVICESCRSKLGLFTDETIARHISLYKKSAKKHSYEEEIRDRLIQLANDYAKKRIKLLHIQDRLKHIKNG